MTKHYIPKPIYSLLLVMAILTSCNGQVKTVVQNEKDNTLTGQAKIPPS
jgi:hypothetical protein